MGEKKLEEGKGNLGIEGEVRVRLVEATFDKVIGENNYDYYSQGIALDLGAANPNTSANPHLL